MLILFRPYALSRRFCLFYELIILKQFSNICEALCCYAIIYLEVEGQETECVGGKFSKSCFSPAVGSFCSARQLPRAGLAMYLQGIPTLSRPVERTFPARAGLRASRETHHNLSFRLSIFTLARPDSALTGFVVVCGVVAIIMGVADILLYVKVLRFTGFGPIVSLLSIRFIISIYLFLLGVDCIILAFSKVGTRY